MVVNSCLEDLDGKMRLKRMWKLIPQVGIKKNKLMEVSCNPGFRKFHQKGLMVDRVSPAETWEDKAWKEQR